MLRITGGHPDTIPVNAALAAAAEELGVGIGLAQRAAIDDPAQRTFRIVREKLPIPSCMGTGAASSRMELKS